MKILFCIGSMGKGGAERVMANLANYFIVNNEVGMVITVNETPKYELDKKITFFRLDDKSNKNIIIRNIKRIRKLNEIINIFKPDIIISFLPEPTYRVLMLKKINKIPVIVSVRNDPKVEYKSILNRIIMRILYPLADGFVFQTEEAKEYFDSKIQKKSIIIPNPLKEEFINRTIYTGEKEKIIVSVGRLEEQKNQKLLIQAFYEIQDIIPEYKLIIYGEGSLRKELEEQIAFLNLTSKVELPGEINNIPNKIEKASIFVLSSNFEGMPNALMEAMALGLPCISTDCSCGGPRFLIKDNEENGILIKNNDIKELKEKIVELIKNKDKYNQIANNAKKIRINLNSKKINKKWENYIVNILKNRRKNESI